MAIQCASRTPSKQPLTVRGIGVFARATVDIDDMCPHEKLGARLGDNQRLADIHVLRSIVLQPIVLVVDVLMDGLQMLVPAAPCQRRICLYANAAETTTSVQTQVVIN